MSSAAIVITLLMYSFAIVGMECYVDSQKRLRNCCTCVCSVHARTGVYRNLSMAEYYHDGGGDYYLLNFDALFHSYGLWLYKHLRWCIPVQ
jgi:hypothetical protein